MKRAALRDIASRRTGNSDVVANSNTEQHEMEKVHFAQWRVKQTFLTKVWEQLGVEILEISHKTKHSKYVRNYWKYSKELTVKPR